MRSSALRRTVVTAGVALILVGLTISGVGAQTGQVGADAASDVELEPLTADTVDPTALDVAPDGRVVFAERTGAVKVWHQDGTLVTAAELQVAACGFTCSDTSHLEEGGIHGLVLDRDFARTQRIFLYYSVYGSMDEATSEGVWRLSSFVLDGDSVLHEDTEQVLLENPALWTHCCHYGGDMEWMADGTLLLSVGDDTSPREEGYNPRDKRDGRAAFDADRTAGNPADRRGKILRLNADGTVPADNPHVDDPAYDPYVYAMGFRNPYRIGYDPVTDVVLVGNVGPDASTSDSSRGPEGMDEWEVVPPGGGTNHGWPYCIGDNEPYHDYDYETQESRGEFSCEGMTPAQVWYPSAPTVQFPLLLAGGRTAMGGPVYRYDGDGALQLPDTYQGVALLPEWSRDLVLGVPLRDDGNLDPTLMRHVSSAVRHPIDARVGPDGALYLAEYGEFYYDNTTSRISRLTCRGCEPSSADYEDVEPASDDEDPEPDDPQGTPEPDDPQGTPGADSPRPAPGAQGDRPLPATGGGLALAGVVLVLAGTIRIRRVV